MHGDEHLWAIVEDQGETRQVTQRWKAMESESVMVRGASEAWSVVTIRAGTNPVGE